MLFQVLDDGDFLGLAMLLLGRTPQQEEELTAAFPDLEGYLLEHLAPSALQVGANFDLSRIFRLCTE